MLFIVAEKSPVLFLCLTHEDEAKLRRGATLYVEPRMTGDRFFNEVVLSLYRTKDDVVAMLKKVQPDAKILDHLPEPPPREGEVKCAGCGCSSPHAALFEDTCIVCWAVRAKSLEAMSN